MQDTKPVTKDEAFSRSNRLEKEILSILFEYNPVMTFRMKLEAAQKISKLITPHKR